MCSMAYQFASLTAADGRQIVDPAAFRDALHRLLDLDAPRYRRLWAYYRNPMRCRPVGPEDCGSARPYRQAQEWGLPSRITGRHSGIEPFVAQPVEEVARKEVVIENDIAWRIDTMVDYLFGKPPVIECAGEAGPRKAIIDRLLNAILEHNGGILLLQRLALLGAVYGFVDVLVKLHDPRALERGGGRAPEAAGAASAAGPARHGAGAAAPEVSADTPPDDARGPGASTPSPEAFVESLARMIRLEVVEPARALPVLRPDDCSVIDAYAQCWHVRRAPSSRTTAPRAISASWWRRLLAPRPADTAGDDSETVLVVEIISPAAWQRYENETLVAQGPNLLGRLPLVHIQNIAMPFHYAGASDVEPLIPLQDELNTRLSDRANRITLQSFKMYLGKGIENFTDMPVQPGRMWVTDNEKADVIEFGGDTGSAAESLHIADIREALDKTSGVSPVAAGAIKDRIGRLTSAAALRITLISLLARTDRKRSTYGQGIRDMLAMSLDLLDRAGLFHTDPAQRRVEIHWPSPLPENLMEKLQEAEAKTRLGVPREVVLRELGY